MRPASLAGVVPAILTVLVLASCGEPERPLWAFRDGAIDEMDLEGVRFADPEDVAEPVAEGCQQVMRMRLEERFPGGGEASADDIRAMLRGARRISTSCTGSCDGESCRAQAITAMRDRMQTARNRCVCAPREKPPCAFVVDWELGEETRRRIRHLKCEPGDEADADSCGFLIGGRKKELTLTCALGGGP